MEAEEQEIQSRIRHSVFWFSGKIKWKRPDSWLLFERLPSEGSLNIRGAVNVEISHSEPSSFRLVLTPRTHRCRFDRDLCVHSREKGGKGEIGKRRAEWCFCLKSSQGTHHILLLCHAFSNYSVLRGRERKERERKRERNSLAMFW